jgi:uncharacterized repeat protein (TIGR01451 family)
VLLYQGSPTARDFDMPAKIGLRPGYLYRVQLTNFAKHPGVSLFPTLEVRGTLAPSPHLSPAAHPVPIVFTADDIDRILAGSFITKVIYLERPDQAVPVATQPDQPLEDEVLPGRDLLADARSRGRLLLILRMGERGLSPAEMALESVAGTILFPHDKALAPPARPPDLHWVCWPFFDPKLGPLPPVEECLPDGGDHGQPAGIGPDGRLHGLDPADTVAEYTDSKGQRRLAISNCVCVCAPRYAVLRTEVAPLSHTVILNLAGAHNIQPQAMTQLRLASLENEQLVAAAAVLSPQKSTEAEVIQGLWRLDQFQETALAVGKVKGVEVAGTCPPKPGPDRPLVLCKSVDQTEARIGDVVTFSLRYSNVGARPITDVVVSDSLTTRLEYVPGSAQSDRETTFTTQANEAGSVILRWQIAGSLAPGQSGTLRFQARIR